MRTVGVEEELLLVDPRTGQLVPAADRVVGGDPRIVGEFAQEMVELRTRPHTDPQSVLDELCELRATIAERATAAGAAAAALSVSPLTAGGTVTDAERYHRIVEEYGVLPRRHLTCGCHVHVGVGDEDEGVAALAGLRAWLPALMALTAGSPFHDGEDTGFASYRWQLTSRWPVSGPPPVCGSAACYHRYVDGLVASGVILDAGMVYLDARLSSHLPTVEIRIADVTPDVEHTAAFALAVRALVETVADPDGGSDPETGPGPVASPVEPATWLASWRGLTGDLVDPRTGRPAPAAEVLSAFVEHVRPALQEAGDLDRVTSWVAGVLRTGGEAQRHREIARRAGALGAVVADVVRRTADLPG